MAIRRSDASGNFFYDYELNCSHIDDPLVYPPCPEFENIHSRQSPICFGANMSCTPGAWVRAEVGVDLAVDAPYYIEPTQTYKWKVIGERANRPPASSSCA